MNYPNLLLEQETLQLQTQVAPAAQGLPVSQNLFGGAVGIEGLASATLVVTPVIGGTVWVIEAPQDLKQTASPVFNIAHLAGLILGSGNQIAKIWKASGTLDFPNTSGQSSSDLDLSVPGITVNDFVIPTFPLPPGNTMYQCIGPTMADKVTFRFVNPTGAAINPGVATFSVLVIQLA